MKSLSILALISCFIFFNCSEKQPYSANNLKLELSQNKGNLYIIERTIPGAGKLTQEELQGISQTSCNVLDNLGSDIKWLHSYVTGDKVYCVYTAKDISLIKSHAKQGGFPADNIAQVSSIIDPETAN